MKTCKKCLGERDDTINECPKCKAARHLEWRRKNREHCLAYHRNYTRTHPEKMRAFYRKRELWRKYGISILDYDNILLSQGGKCALCGSDNPKGYFGRFHVDHDHKTNKIRGLICGNCNLIIGHAGDDIRLLRLAIRYLEKAKSNEEKHAVG